jgi:carboxypeptidase family protein
MSKLRVCLTLAIATLAACQKQTTSEPAPAAPAAAPAAQARGATGSASITGTVKLTGTPPEMQLTKRQADPFCARTPMKEEDVVVGAGGGLKNVVVRVIKGLGGGRYDPPATPAVVDQSACMYRPRVQGIVLGQPLQIKNSDQTLHNVHGYKGASTLFNQAEIPGQPPMTKQLTAADEIIKLKCDVHPWMTAWVLVSTNPFFAVTGDDGSFKITGLPAGSYTVQAWHERYGAKTAEITLAADKPAEASFQFGSAP